RDGEAIEIVGFKATEMKIVTGGEMIRKLLDAGGAGDNVGVLLRGVENTDVERGQVLAEPGSLKPDTRDQREANIGSDEDGGGRARGWRDRFCCRTRRTSGPWCVRRTWTRSRASSSRSARTSG